MIIKLAAVDAHSVNITIIGPVEEITTIVKGLGTIKGAATAGELLTGGFCYGTFYAEDDANIYGVTDDVEERVATRDGEEPAAIIFLYHRK